VNELVPGYLERFDARYESQLNNPRATGFPSFNHKFGSFRPGHFIVVGARPSIGKTSFALNVARAIANRMPVFIFSLEMSRDQVMDRLISADAEIASTSLALGKLTREESQRFLSAVANLRKLPIHINYHPGISIQTICALSRGLQSRIGELGLIVIDYLQLLGGGDHPNRAQELAQFSRALRALAQELCAPVMLVSQLNREVEARKDKRPMMSDLKYCGALEQDADMVIMLYRDKYYHPKSLDGDLAEVLVAKNRNGPVGMVNLQFDGEHTRFLEPSQRAKLSFEQKH
ncbi:MAG: AAA family ATPase, partial [Moorea sp. SIO3C2]|nr:AAA family ATPase [Moorena sp. SIO3C2]